MPTLPLLPGAVHHLLLLVEAQEVLADDHVKAGGCVPHLDPVDADIHLAPLADGKGEEERHGQPHSVEHGEAEEGLLRGKDLVVGFSGS